MLTQLLSMEIGVGHYGATLSPVITLGDWMRQPDSCWGPAWGRPYTVVLEVAAAAPGSEEELKGDVKVWIESPGSCGYLVIMICIDVLRPRQQMGDMTIAKWESRSRNCNRTAMRTTVLTIQTQTNTVTVTATDLQSGDDVPCDELRVPFETIFHRAPAGQEKDIVFYQDAFLKIADTVWKQIRAERNI